MSPLDHAVGHHRRYARSDLEALFHTADLSKGRITPWGWPFGRLYDRWIQVPALTVRSEQTRSHLARLGRSRWMHRFWHLLFAVDARLASFAGERGSGWVAVVRKPR